MNKKGFTLIEMIGVVVLIGVIAVITVPIVKNITKDAKQKGYEKQINVVLNSAKNWAIQNTDLLLEDGTGVLVKIDTLKKEGLLENRKIINPVTNNEINGCAKITYNTDFNQYKYDYSETCLLPNSILSSENSCIQSRNACSTDDIKSGIIVNVKVNNEQTEDFYVLADDGNKVTLILNRNLGDNVAWISKSDYIEAGGTEADYGIYGNNNKGPITVLTALQARTSAWTNLPEMIIRTFDYDAEREDVTLGSKKTFTTYARLPKYSEIYAINNSTDLSNTPWLYINLSGTGGTSGGYWTSTARTSYSDLARFVNDDGNVYSDMVYDASALGFRPVIELQKWVSVY